MVMILKDLIFKLNFLCIPMALESVAKFGERTKELNKDGVEEEMMKITNAAMQAVAQNKPIPSTLTSSLLKVINRSYIKHLIHMSGVLPRECHKKHYRVFLEVLDPHVSRILNMSTSPFKHHWFSLNSSFIKFCPFW